MKPHSLELNGDEQQAVGLFRSTVLALLPLAVQEISILTQEKVVASVAKARAASEAASKEKAEARPA